MTRIAILDDFQDAARSSADWSRLSPRATPTVFTDHVTGDALVERLQPFEVVVAIRERTLFPAALLDRLPNLRMIATVGMRNAGIDVAHCGARGVVVSGTQGGGTPTAELAFGLILALSRNIVAEDRSLRAGTWQTPRIGSVVRGRTLGLLGLGTLGRAVAAMGRAFGMEPIAWSPNLTAERAEAGGARLVDKPTLFARSDFLSVHMVLAEGTRGLVDAEAIGQMRPDAFLVNTSRAGLVDGAALVAALHAGHIGGAGLDVFDVEPIPADDPLLAAPNTILTPHLGYSTRENYDLFFPQLVESIAAFLDGSPIRVLGGK